MSEEQTETESNIEQVVDLIATGSNQTLMAMQQSLGEGGMSPILGLLIMQHMAGILYDYAIEGEHERVHKEAQGNPNIPEEAKTPEACAASVDQLHQQIRDYVTAGYMPLKKSEADVVIPGNGQVH